MSAEDQHGTEDCAESVADRVVARALETSHPPVMMEGVMTDCDQLAGQTIAAIHETGDGAILASVVDAIPCERTANVFLEALGDRIARSRAA